MLHFNELAFHGGSFLISIVLTPLYHFRQYRGSIIGTPYLIFTRHFRQNLPIFRTNSLRKWTKTWQTPLGHQPVTNQLSLTPSKTIKQQAITHSLTIQKLLVRIDHLFYMSILIILENHYWIQYEEKWALLILLIERTHMLKCVNQKDIKALMKVL